MEERTCKYCGVGYRLKPRIFSNHVRWCKDNPTRNNTKNISNATINFYNKKLGEKKEFNVNCAVCKKEIRVYEREYQHPLRHIYFCGRSCANTRKQSENTKAKISAALSLPVQNRRCEQCNVEFKAKIKSKKRFCSIKCSKVARRVGGLAEYKNSCKFRFNVYNFPSEFDLSLLDQYGWYSASNRGGNLGGISRDHRISIKYGWHNNIPAEFMAHPANCVLMRQCDNFKKLDKCSIDLEELKLHIREWNEKYGS